jgi:hypothetical protein
MSDSNPICVLWLNVLSVAMDDIKAYYSRKSPTDIERVLKDEAMKWIRRAKGMTFTQCAASANRTNLELKKMCLFEIARFKSQKHEKHKNKNRISY